VLTGVTADMRAYSEELFGPVAVVYRVDSDDEAIALANDSRTASAGPSSAATVSARRRSRTGSRQGWCS
jgi:succinate-semialdehyde dehydrogenase / glutarate-semialdehyde dehydrogenase